MSGLLSDKNKMLCISIGWSYCPHVPHFLPHARQQHVARLLRFPIFSHVCLNTYDPSEACLVPVLTQSEGKPSLPSSAVKLGTLSRGHRKFWWLSGVMKQAALRGLNARSDMIMTAGIMKSSPLFQEQREWLMSYMLHLAIVGEEVWIYITFIILPRKKFQVIKQVYNCCSTFLPAEIHINQCFPVR